MSNNQHIKVSLLYKDTEGNIQVETVRAEKVGMNYKVLNIPFFASGVSYGDVISVEEDGNEFFFDELIAPSGHTTIQMIFFEKGIIEKTCQDLVNIGCDWEGSHLEGYISVDVPPAVDYALVKQYLDDGFSSEKWDYKEATLAHPTT